MPGFKPKGKGGGKAGASAKGKLSGGHWVTINGHPAYIKDGKVVAGGGVGHTHDAKGKPSGRPVKLDKSDVPLARAHVVKQVKADRIRGNAPGKDASGVDHAAMHAAVRKHAAENGKAGRPLDVRYSHGPGSSRADREHLARAEKAGGVAVKATVTPKVDVERGRNSTGYHVGGNAAARVVHTPNEDGRYVARKTSGSHTEAEEHRTLKGAHAAARRHAAKVAREDTATKRYVVKKASPADIVDRVTPGGHDDSTRIHVLHRGRGSSAPIPGSGFRPGR